MTTQRVIETGTYREIRYMICAYHSDWHDWFAAYVEVPEGHAKNEEDICCHGGVTYQDFEWPMWSDLGLAESDRIIGWDYGHGWDRDTRLEEVQKDVRETIDDLWQRNITRIGFRNEDGREDETEFDTWDEESLATLWWYFCKENKLITIDKLKEDMTDQ